MATKKAKKTKRPLTEEQKKEIQKKKAEKAFKKKIRTTISGSGFEYFSTEFKEFKIGNRVVELDYLFVYKNIILICEDTCGKKKDTDHIRKKSEAFKQIQENVPTLISWLSATFPEKEEMFNEYRADRYFVYYIYIPQVTIDITDEDKARFSNIIFWEPKTLTYFYRMSQCIQFSARYEIFRFLGLKNENIGHSGSEGGQTTIKAPIIYPDEATGLENGIKVVSFMMSADKLLKTSYVLRKDNWEESIFLYQRLIDKEKIKGIRKFLATNKEAFYNNIIVALPDTVKFELDSGKVVSIDEVGDFQRCKLIMPDEMNSVCVIDGQHRIFAHYEANDTEKFEKEIKKLRKRLHLLVTGLIFPADMKDSERKRIQSEIFLDINDNTKKVAPNVLTHIEMIKDPFSDIGLARRVIERLNGKRTFLNRFEICDLDESKIKVASIIKFALRYLVTITPADGKTSLYHFWEGDKIALEEKNEDALKDYIEFCAQQLDLYFSTIRDTFKDSWNSQDHKLLSVIAINGFIIAYNRQLSKNGLRDYQFYNECLKKMTIDFSKEAFPYTSSQYRKFSTLILEQAFGFTEEELETI